MADNLKFGLILANRNVVLRQNTVAELLDMARRAEDNPLFESVWVGDSLFVNPRLDFLTLLAAIASQTDRVLLGPACMGSFALRDPLVFAHHWVGLDQLAEGRARLIVCAGGGTGPVWDAESQALGIDPKDRRKIMLENMAVLRHLWTSDGQPFAGTFRRFDWLALELKPSPGGAQIWLATNTKRMAAVGGAGEASDLSVNRVAQYADGWMTHSIAPEAFRGSWNRILQAAQNLGRNTEYFDNCLYYNINIDDDKDRALRSVSAFLNEYYNFEFAQGQLDNMLTWGSPAHCIEALRAYRGKGVKRIAFRLCTQGDPFGQFERLARDVLPYINE
ncbi:MAG: LLM class flavin-dependent oxidoreductase [Proteobacteria bacterium]|nr:LLM class flavin-dependent oxidoreductase [Pseudomonadota bacterium]